MRALKGRVDRRCSPLTCGLIHVAAQGKDSKSDSGPGWVPKNNLINSMHTLDFANVYHLIAVSQFFSGLDV